MDNENKQIEYIFFDIFKKQTISTTKHKNNFSEVLQNEN